MMAPAFPIINWVKVVGRSVGGQMMAHIVGLGYLADSKSYHYKR